MSLKEVSGHVLNVGDKVKVNNPPPIEAGACAEA